MVERLLCALCRQRPVEPRWRPFCSERCKMTDLGRWLSGDYRIPASPAGVGLTDDDARDDDDGAEPSNGA